MTKIPHLRWWIAGLLFLASVLNYLDRQTLSILAPTIQQEMKLTDQDYALVVNLFLVAYTAATLLSGNLVDRLGVRVSLATTFGVIAAGSALGGMVMNWAVGRLVTQASYGPAFFVMAVVHPLALLLVWRLRKLPAAR